MSGKCCWHLSCSIIMDTLEGVWTLSWGMVFPVHCMRYFKDRVKLTWANAGPSLIRPPSLNVKMRICGFSIHIDARGVLGLKTDGGVPLAAENWTQKDRVKKLNLGPKRSIFVKIGSFCTPKDSFAVGGWEKYPKKIVLDPAKVKKGGQNRGTYVSPIT